MGSAVGALRHRRNMAKHPHMSVAHAMQLADTGDVLLVREKATVAGFEADPAVVRGIVATQRQGDFSLQHWEVSGWNNAGLVLRRDGDLVLLEATANGVELFPLEARLRFHVGASFRVALRRMHVVRSPQLLDRVDALVAAVGARGGLWWNGVGAALAAQRDADDLGLSPGAGAAAAGEAKEEQSGEFSSEDQHRAQLAFAARMLALMRYAAARVTPQQHVELQRAMALAEGGDMGSCPREAVAGVLTALLPSVDADDAARFQGAFHADRVAIAEFEEKLRGVPRAQKPFEVNSQLLLGGALLAAALEQLELLRFHAGEELQEFSPMSFSSASRAHLPLQGGAALEPEIILEHERRVKRGRLPRHLRV